MSLLLRLLARNQVITKCCCCCFSCWFLSLFCSWLIHVWYVTYPSTRYEDGSSPVVPLGKVETTTHFQQQRIQKSLLKVDFYTNNQTLIKADFYEGLLWRFGSSQLPPNPRQAGTWSSEAFSLIIIIVVFVIVIIIIIVFKGNDSLISTRYLLLFHFIDLFCSMLSPLTMIVSWLCNTRRRQQTQRPDLVSHEEPRGVARNFDGTSLEAAGGSLADQFLNSSSVSWWILFQYDISGGSNMWYIFAQCLPPLKQDIWIRSRCQDENVLFTETFLHLINKQTKTCLHFFSCV